MDIAIKVKKLYGLSRIEYDCLVRLGETPGYLKQASLFDRYDLQLMAQLQKLIEKGFCTYNEKTKDVFLTDKGEEVWNLEE
jgi:hypothetical protein